MTVIQLVANGTDLITRKNKNVVSKKVFVDEDLANKFKDEFYCICTNPIDGTAIQLDINDPIDISFVDLELIEEE